MIINIFVNLLGIVFDNILKRNFFLMWWWFGFKVRNVEGILIVNKLINVICVGCKGYVMVKIIVKIDISKEKIFFIRNKFEECLMLLIIWWFLKIIFGIVEKLEFNNIICEVCVVVWFFEVMVIL